MWMAANKVMIFFFAEGYTVLVVLYDTAGQISVTPWSTSLKDRYLCFAKQLVVHLMIQVVFTPPSQQCHDMSHYYHVNDKLQTVSLKCSKEVYFDTNFKIFLTFTYEWGNLSKSGFDSFMFTLF